MGIRNTANDEKIALFDSVTGLAFGPVFDTETECDEFLAWCEEHGVTDKQSLIWSADKLHEEWKRGVDDREESSRPAAG